MKWLIYLYPRGFRQRYGGELRDLVSSESPSLRLFVDLLAGAVDARLNSHIAPAAVPPGETKTVTTLGRLCDRSRHEKLNSRWMIGASLALVAIALIVQLAFEQEMLGQMILLSAFPVALILAGERRYLERWPRAVRGIVLGASVLGMFGFFALVTWIAESF